MISLVECEQPAEAIECLVVKMKKSRMIRLFFISKLAEPTGFEPATSDVTGRRSNQLNYDSALEIQICSRSHEHR